MYQQHMLLKLRKPNLKYTLNKYHVHWLSSLNISNCLSVLNTCHYMANCLYLHDSYMTKFDFMDYAFVKLEVALLENILKEFYLTWAFQLFWSFDLDHVVIMLFHQRMLHWTFDFNWLSF